MCDKRQVESIYIPTYINFGHTNHISENCKQYQVILPLKTNDQKTNAERTRRPIRLKEINFGRLSSRAQAEEAGYFSHPV